MPSLITLPSASRVCIRQVHTTKPVAPPSAALAEYRAGLRAGISAPCGTGAPCGSSLLALKSQRAGLCTKQRAGVLRCSSCAGRVSQPPRAWAAGQGTVQRPGSNAAPALTPSRMAGQLMSQLSRNASALGRLSRASQAEDTPDIETPMLAGEASSSRPALAAVEIAHPTTPSKDALQV